MTSKLKCPFCGDNLRLHEDCIWGLFACSHPTCEKSANMYGTKELWAALIQAKQDLEIARKVLEDARILADTHCIASAVKTIDKALETIGKHNE